MRILVLLAVLGGAAPVMAQENVASSFADLSRVVKKGNVVFVQDDKGERTKGKITELSDASLQIMTGEPGRTQTFSADRVARVSTVDSRWNGFLLGAAAGAVPGLLLGHGFKSWCVNESGSHCNSMYAYGGVPLGLIGGWIGYLIDGVIDGQTLVYRTGAGVSLKF